MDKFDSTKLYKDQVQAICDFINNKHSEITEVCVNELIREDILALLDKYCTVIYYPTNDSENNGFHVNYQHDGSVYHFVYINTKQHKEKQIFTAAHELGHIWNIVNVIGIENDTQLEERVINRFASELLMPREHFLRYTTKELKVYLNEDNSISESDMIKVITATMNHFFTSYKSVIYRFYEIGMLTEENCRILWGETQEHPREQLIELSQKVAKENGYSRLYQTDERKWINGLKELLDNTSENNLLPVEWLKEFYTKFDFKQTANTANLDDTLSILNLEEDVNNDC